MSHAESMAVHAIRRFKQRCDADLPRAEYDRMVRFIRTGEAPAVALTQNSTRVFMVRFAGTTAFAVWSSELNQIATFYPSIDWVLAKGGKRVCARGLVSA